MHTAGRDALGIVLFLLAIIVLALMFDFHKVMLPPLRPIDIHKQNQPGQTAW